MKAVSWHEWRVNAARAREIQLELAAQVSRVGKVNNPHLIAGVDISVNKKKDMGTGAVVVLSFPELELVETRVVIDRLEFPYVPGLLSFRESPLILAACERLSVTPDLIMVDGQGIAHPRRIGLASHLGLILGIPTIGCAKSRLCGRHDIPENEPGSFTDLIDEGEVIGAVLRTKENVKPVYVSVGHKVELLMAVHWVTVCCRGYRLPEPTRLAHQAAGGNLKTEKHRTLIKAGY
ncbi:deoxyribonuclease V [Chloroflexota bacterium]